VVLCTGERTLVEKRKVKTDSGQTDGQDRHVYDLASFLVCISSLVGEVWKTGPEENFPSASV
jgi:hypothetical protein